MTELQDKIAQAIHDAQCDCPNGNPESYQREAAAGLAVVRDAISDLKPTRTTGDLTFTGTPSEYANGTARCEPVVPNSYRAAIRDVLRLLGEDQ